MARPKILRITWDAAASLDVISPCQRIGEPVYEVRITALTKKKLRFVVHDFEPGYDAYTEKPGHSSDADLAFAEIDPADFVALVVQDRAIAHPARRSFRSNPPQRAARLRLSHRPEGARFPPSRGRGEQPPPRRFLAGSGSVPFDRGSRPE